jgi:mRNA-degrading endonuclease toxin of MazEF toxin-antitoxin module
MFGEVFLCEFPFTSGSSSKIRPALVLFDLDQDALICRVTSVVRTGPLDTPIVDWQACGLLRPSVARLDRLVTAERSVFRRRLGVLSGRDIDAVREKWNRHMRL